MAETKKLTSVKHLQIDKSQTAILGVVIAATVVVIFSLFATKSLIVKGAYERRATNARKQVVGQLKTNYDNANKLLTQYKVFAEDNPNILGGNVVSTGDSSDNANLDGSNPVIVLDALPSSYDAPALASSIEKILSNRGLDTKSIGVKDDPASNPDAPTTNPTAQPMPFSFSGTTTYQNTVQLLQDFERSIRPFDVNTITISGTDSSLTSSITVTTYFQPAKVLNLQATKEVK